MSTEAKRAAAIEVDRAHDAQAVAHRLVLIEARAFLAAIDDPAGVPDADKLRFAVAAADAAQQRLAVASEACAAAFGGGA